MGNRQPYPQAFALFALCFLAAFRGGPGMAADCNQNRVEDPLDLSPQDFGFTPLVVPALAFRPLAVAISDVDGDGDLDLATAGSSPSPDGVPLASVLLNGGGGSFGAPESLPAGDSPTALSTADLEGDGSPELAVASGFTILLLEYHHGRGLELREVLIQGTPPVAILSADLDGDREPDLATANSNPGGEFPDNVSILLNAGAGRLSPGRNYGVGRNPRSITAADLDRDGDLDLVTADSDSRGLSVLSNEGNGVFKVPVKLEVGGSPAAAIAGDFDGDGSPDLLAAAPQLPLYLNRGDGAFLAPVTVWVRAATPVALTAGDLDRDGDQDLVLALGFLPAIVILRNDARGSFPREESYLSGSFQKTSLAAGDLDGDGDLDLAGAGGALTLLFNRDPAFASEEIFAAGTNPTSLAAADLDADGLLDLAVTDSVSNESGSLSIFFNGGGGALEPGPAFPVKPHPHRLLAADLDADGDLDLALTASDFLQVKLNSGGRNFNGGGFTGTEEPLGGQLPSLAAGDLDGDGRNEILVGAENEGLVVLAVNSSGGLERRKVIQLGVLKFFPYFMVAANLDEDPLPEVAIVTGDTNRLLILWNDGPAGLSQSMYYSGSNGVWVDAVDLDRDGDRDLVILNLGFNRMTVYPNHGNRTFGQDMNFPTRPGPFTGVTGDLDGDGDVDVALGGDTLTTHLNQGAWQFSGPLLHAGLPKSFDVDLACGDLDGDGFLDLMVARSGATPGTISVLRNTSLPAFSEDRNRNQVPDECERGAFRRGDVVRDGALDLTDVVQVLSFLFLGAPLEACPDAADADDDGRLGLTDPIRVLGSLFLGDGPLPPPRSCGLDPTGDALPACPPGFGC